MKKYITTQNSCIEIDEEDLEKPESNLLLAEIWRESFPLEIHWVSGFHGAKKADCQMRFSYISDEDPFTFANISKTIFSAPAFNYKFIFFYIKQDPPSCLKRKHNKSQFNRECKHCTFKEVKNIYKVVPVEINCAAITCL